MVRDCDTELDHVGASLPGPTLPRRRIRRRLDADPLTAHPLLSHDTAVGMACRPKLMGIAARHARRASGLPIVVTEGSIADDGPRLVICTPETLWHLVGIHDGVIVRSQVHRNSSECAHRNQPSGSSPSTPIPPAEPVRASARQSTLRSGLQVAGRVALAER
jgi:hypothetical protein